MSITKAALGIVLAGGRSSRMGQDKAALLWQGQPLLERQALLLRQVGCDAVLIVGREIPGWPSLPDAQAYRGPAAALAVAVRQLEALFAQTHGRIVVVPVDMPLLSAAHLAALMQHPAPLVAYAGHPLPCVMTITPQIQHTLTQHAGKSGASLQALWDLVGGAAWLPTPENGSFLTNVNTPDDWVRVQRFEQEDAS